MGFVDLVRPVAKSVFAAADPFIPNLRGPRILIYHQIGAGLGRQMEVTQEDFVRQIDWMQEQGEIVDLDTALDRRSESDSDRLFVLTFDDGYRDFFMSGFPLLYQRRLPFTVYLATESIETGIPLTPGGRAEPLDWRQIETMLETGLMTIGAHTHRHVDLRDRSVDEVETELGTSDNLITERLGVSPATFAYPWGYWSRDADSVVAKTYRSAVLGSGAPVSEQSSLHRVNRVPVQLGDGLRFFKKKMLGGMRLEDVTRRAIRRYHGP
jgi:peptidoglycan/xylan/chitin deacetylase (PgdA/CDA1 family)